MAESQENNNQKPSSSNGEQNNGVSAQKSDVGNSTQSMASNAANAGGSNGSRAEAVAVVKNAVVSDEVESVIIRGEAESVKLENIEKGLTNLWQAAAKSRDGEGEAPVMRACVMNLVIYADSPSKLAAVTEVVAKLTWSYPCRALVLVSEPENNQNDMQAWISTHCQQPGGKGQKVCCEQITIRGYGEASERLDSMILPLLVPDLPVVVWWPGDVPLESVILQRILANADRFIADSSKFSDYLAGLGSMAALATSHSNVIVSDFNWSRLTPWRGLIANLFDTPQLLPYLFNMERMEVEFVQPQGEKPNLAMAVLLVGWLACKLNWQPAFALKQRGRNFTLILNQNGQPLSIDFKVTAEANSDPGCVTGIKIVASNDNKEAHFGISLADGSGLAYIMVEENNNPNTRKIMLSHRDDADLLIEELREMQHDPTYEQVLRMVADILVTGIAAAQKG